MDKRYRDAYHGDNLSSIANARTLESSVHIPFWSIEKILDVVIGEADYHSNKQGLYAE